MNVRIKCLDDIRPFMGKIAHLETNHRNLLWPFKGETKLVFIFIAPWFNDHHVTPFGELNWSVPTTALLPVSSMHLGNYSIDLEMATTSRIELRLPTDAEMKTIKELTSNKAMRFGLHGSDPEALHRKRVEVTEQKAT
jgi:hypothetical protein